MFALVNKSDNSIIKTYTGRKGIRIGENQYPQSIFTLWSEAERNAIDIYTIEEDNSKKKSTEWYINTDITYTFDGSKVTGSYGDATARAHADTLWTSQDKTDGKIPTGKDVGDVAVEGLKTVLINQVKSQAEGELNKTDWYIIRKADTDEAIPSAIATHRAAVRSKQASMETEITNASDTPALETLFTYTKQEDGSVTRPLGQIPTLED
tara:strand:+ start:104 stop:730 length:627 start_codon:yes stop_codon:yes gene_type:complete